MKPDDETKFYRWNPDALNKATPEKRNEIFTALVERLGMFVSAMDDLYIDNHYWSKRPCSTCDTHSKNLGFDIGCTRFRKDPKWRRDESKK